MLGLGLPERAGGGHLGDNLTRPKAGSIDIGDGGCSGVVDEQVRGVGGGVVDEVQVGSRQVGQDLAGIESLLLQAFDLVGDVADGCGVPDAVGEFGSSRPDPVCWSQFHVPGMICMIPRALVGEIMALLKPDSS